MYQPVFNSVLVEIEDKDAQWGSGNDDSMLGKSFSKGKVITVAGLVATGDHPLSDIAIEKVSNAFKEIKGESIMWNQGTEAGTEFEHEGKKYGFIYWWDIRGVLDNDALDKAKAKELADRPR